MFEIIVGGLVVIIGVVFGLAIFVMCDDLDKLLIANEEVDNDLTDIEETIRDHDFLLEDLERMRKQLESLPSRVAALENRNRIIHTDEGDDVVYATY